MSDIEYSVIMSDVIKSFDCICSFYLFCRPVLLDYLVAPVVRVPDPIGDTFNFSKYVGLYPASTLFPKKYKENQAYPKNIWNLATPNTFYNTVP